MDTTVQPSGLTRNFAAVASFLLAAAFFLLSGLLRPEYNWDVIGYVGAVRALDSGDSVAVHDSTYAEIARAEGTRHYASANPTDTPYRALMRASPSAFFETLRFYRARAGYVHLVSALTRLGVNVVDATHLLSAACVFLGMGPLFLIARRLLPPAFQLLVPLAALLLGFAEAARLSTPDGLAFALMIACAYLFLSGGRTLFAFLPLLVLVRPDLVLLVFLVCSSAVLSRKPLRAYALLSLAASILLYAALDRYAGSPGWQHAFRFTFVDRLSAGSGGLTLEEYLLAAARGGWGALKSPAFLLFAAAAAGALTLSRSGGKWRGSPEVLQLLGVSVLFVALRLAAFPLPDARFFVAPYTLTVVCFLALLARAREGPAGGGGAIR